MNFFHKLTNGSTSENNRPIQEAQLALSANSGRIWYSYRYFVIYSSVNFNMENMAITPILK